MKRILQNILIASLFLSLKANASISLVYNLRIAESTKRQEFEKGVHPYTISFTAINNNRKKRDDTRQNLVGLLESFSYVNSRVYVRTDFAFGQIREAHECSRLKEIETDDLLFKAGYSYYVTQKMKLSASGLFGIPIHKDFALQHHQLGYGHFGLGFQLDGSFNYLLPKTSAIRAAFRLIQFLPRHALYKDDDITKRYTINLGTLIDVFIAHHTVFEHHSFELGYDQIFFCNGKIHPYKEGLLEKFNYIRPEFFSTYKYTIATRRTHHILSATISAGFDIWPWLHGNKRIIEAWFSYGINF